MNFFNELFGKATMRQGFGRQVFLFIVFAELLSLCGYLLPDFNKITFFVIVLLTLILSLHKLEYGVWIVLAELFIGSKGYLFFFEYDGLVVSIRIALWLVVMAVWLGKVVNSWLGKIKKCDKREELSSEASELSSRSVYGLEFLKSSYFSYFLILFIFIAWGVVNGILSHNEFSNVFFDFNGWLYFTLVFPVYHIVETHCNASLRGILQIFTAAIIWLSVKTFFLLFIFSHNMNSIVSEVYRWVRVSGVGEITQMQGGFYRIFFQSHIFVLVGFFIFLIIAVNQITNKTKKSPQHLFTKEGNYNEKSPQPTFNKGENNGGAIKLFSVICCLLSVILITFSRSFWVGLIFGLLSCFLAFLFFYKIGWKKLLKITGVLIACAIAAFALIAAVVKFPYPSPTGGFSTSELLSERASKVTGESALSSRWALLPKLWDEIKKAPVMGQGFGAVITYQSSDPRVLQTSPTGEYTTYAFEWGWLDIWLKLGLFGVLAYLVLIGKIVISGLKLVLDNRQQTIGNRTVLGLIIGLGVIVVVSIFSPYMNHPLGIGYLILVSAILENFKVKKEGSY